MDFSSKLLENAVNEMSQLPGIGKRTALRLVLHLLKNPKEQTQKLSESLLKMRETINFCNNCHNISDTQLCEICANPNREAQIVCVVEDIRDVMAIENTSQYRGHYHVLGGKISPIEGIGPSDLNVSSLLERAARPNTKEIIMAVSPTIEGDTTIFYLSKQLKPFNLKISTIARGVSFGGELQYADEVTLGRSIASRTKYLK